MVDAVIAGMPTAGQALLASALVSSGWREAADLRVFSGEADELSSPSLGYSAPEGIPERTSPTSVAWGIGPSGAQPSCLLEVRLGRPQDTYLDGASPEPRFLADPRATLALDGDWVPIDADIVLLYRAPWDVVDGCIRFGDAKAARDPSWVRRAWSLYADAMCVAADRLGDRCLVVAAEALRSPNQNGVGQVLERLGAGRAGAPTRYQDLGVSTRDDSHPIVAMYELLFPEVVDRLTALDHLAALPRPKSARSMRHSHLVAGGSLAPGTGIQVVIPCRDDGAHLDETLVAIDLAASAPTEVTIVDDGSTDAETLRILEVLRGSGMQILRSEGIGAGPARNVGMSVSQSLAVLPVDADVRIRANLLEAISLLEQGHADIVHGSWQEFGLRDEVVVPPVATVSTLFPHNRIDTCALVRREIVDRLGGFADILLFEDWDLWLGAIGIGARFHRLSEVTFDYLVRPGSVSAVHGPDALTKARGLRRAITRHRATLSQNLDDLAMQIVDVLRAMVDRVDISEHRVTASFEALGRAHDDYRAAMKKVDEFVLLSEYANLAGREAVAAELRAVVAERRASSLEREVAGLVERVATLERSLGRLRRTRSWRWTAGLRWLERKLLR